MSKIAVNEITDEVGTGAPAFPNGMLVTGAALTDPEITGGIYLGGTGSANKLDDYEEGAWTPQITGWTGSYTTQIAFYTKVGRVVSVFGEVVTTAGTGSFSNNFPGLAGLPFGGLTGTASDINGIWASRGSTSSSFPSQFIAVGSFDSPSSSGNSMFPNVFSTVYSFSNFQSSYIDTSVDWGFRFQAQYFTDA